VVLAAPAGTGIELGRGLAEQAGAKGAVESAMVASRVRSSRTCAGAGRRLGLG
jgi:hypothetical protein